MASKRYAKISALIDGKFASELTSVNVDFQGGLLEVATMDGISGYTEGPGKVAIAFGQAVPIGGLAFDLTAAIANHTTHHVQVAIGGQSYSATGVFLNGNISGSATANTEANYSFEGPLQPMT